MIHLQKVTLIQKTISIASIVRNLKPFNGNYTESEPDRLNNRNCLFRKFLVILQALQVLASIYNTSEDCKKLGITFIL